MTRLPTTLLAFAMLASLVASVPSVAGTTEKARILAELSTAPSRSTARVKTSRQDCAELVLDLIVYRWASRSAKGTPTDVRNIDGVISGLASALNDPIINWALGAFPTTGSAQGSVAPPAGNDPRVEPLTEFSRQFGMAPGWRESSPVQSVNALVIALDACQKVQLELTGALVGSILGNHYHYDMGLYRQAELCYGNASWCFSKYSCHEAAATLYNDYGALCTEMSRSPGAARYYGEAANQWALLAKQYPRVSRYREMAGQARCYSA